MLRGPLVPQTLGTHWTAMAGARKIYGINDLNLPVGKPIGGLGLAAAAVRTAIHVNVILSHFSFTSRACPHLSA